MAKLWHYSRADTSRSVLAGFRPTPKGDMGEGLKKEKAIVQRANLNYNLFDHNVCYLTGEITN